MIISHLVTDSKFIDFFYNMIKEENVENHFFIIRNTGQEIKYIKEAPVRLICKDLYSFFKAVKIINKSDVVIVHYLGFFEKAILLLMRKKIIMWSGWGGDYYYLMKNGEKDLILEQTRKIESSEQLNKKNIHHKIRFYLDIILTKIVLKKIDIFSSPIPNDFEKLKSELKNFNPKYLQINYGDMENTFSSISREPTAQNILVGNSATLTNNHIDTFILLSNIDIGDRKIITPLSYGNQDYKKIVYSKGLEYFGDKFCPITDFLELQNYNKIVSSCAIGIMNQKRQQALGNIGTLLYSGAKLFLNEKNTVYTFFIDRGAIIYKTSELTVSNKNIFTPLSEEEINLNRQILASFWGRNIVKNNITNLINELKSIKKHMVIK